MTTYHELQNAVCSAAGARASVSVIEDVEEQTVHLTVSIPWWALPSWWLRRNTAFAVIRSLVPHPLRWTLERKVRFW
jgi:hypothetical protein